MVSRLRNFIAVACYRLADFIAGCKYSKEDYIKHQKQLSVKPPPLPGTVKFTDVATYFKEVSANEELSNVFINICNKLKNMSVIQGGAIRFNYTTDNTYYPDKDNTAKHSSNISGYNDERWHKISDYDMTGGQAVNVLTEMVEAMAQDGWGCMNDGVHQLQYFLASGSAHAEKYLQMRTKLTNQEAKLRISLSLVINVVEDKQYSQPEPKLVVVLFTWPPGSKVPVKSAHTMFFSRCKSVQSEKNTA